MIARCMMLVAASLSIAAAQPVAKPTPSPGTMPLAPATTFNCVFASSIFMQKMTDQQRKELAHEVLLFYLGRLDPGITELQLKSALQRAANNLNGVNAASLMNECLAEFRAKASMLEAVAKESQPAK